MTTAGVATWLAWTFRTHTYTLAPVSGSLSDDETALAWSRAVLALHGVDPDDYRPIPFGDDGLVSHNTISPNRATTYWTSGSAGGLGVSLDQTGRQVVCGVTRMK